MQYDLSRKNIHKKHGNNPLYDCKRCALNLIGRLNKPMMKWKWKSMTSTKWKISIFGMETDDDVVKKKT